MTKKKLNILRAVLIAVAAICIMTALISRTACIRNTVDYEKVQDELFAPDIIKTVLYDEKSGQLYVCYNDASYVNVYSEDGDFLWAVSTPYLRSTYFAIEDGRLIVYNAEAFVYAASDGTFIERTDADAIGLWDKSEPQDTSRDNIGGNFSFDSFQVYRISSDGETAVIVERPWWYMCLHPVLCWCVGFVALLVAVPSFIFEKRQFGAGS